MNKYKQITVCLFLSFVMAVGMSHAQSGNLIYSSFDESPENWLISGDGTSLRWRSDNGLRGGAICSTDLSQGDVWYFQAPFQDNQSHWYGQILKFDLRQDPTELEMINEPDVVLISHGGDTIYYDNEINPPIDGQWTSYSIRLDADSGWRDSLTGEATTREQMVSILSSLTALKIRGEYINGADSACLDNVQITPPIGVIGSIIIDEPYYAGYRQVTFDNFHPNNVDLFNLRIRDEVFDAQGQYIEHYQYAVRTFRRDGQFAHIGAQLMLATQNTNLTDHWLYIKVYDDPDTAVNADYIGWQWGDQHDETDDLGESRVREWVNVGWSTDFWRVALDGGLDVDWAGIPQCAGTLPSRLSDRHMAKITIDPPNRIRTTPSANSEILGEIPVDQPFIVQQGPVCTEGYAWWLVEYNGIEGWTAEASDDTYWIEPITPSLKPFRDAVINAFAMVGTWDADFGDMTVTIDARATYPDDNGRVLISDFSDNMVKGFWVEGSSNQQCETAVDDSFYWGQVNLTPNVMFTSFTGVWDYCMAELDNTWNAEYSDLTFDFDIQATYGTDNGRIIITHFDSTTLTGYWIENLSEQPCTTQRDGSFFWGRVQFMPDSSQSSFTGLWSYCSAEPTEPWNGVAISS